MWDWSREKNRSKSTVLSGFAWFLIDFGRGFAEFRGAPATPPKLSEDATKIDQKAVTTPAPAALPRGKRLFIKTLSIPLHERVVLNWTIVFRRQNRSNFSTQNQG